MLQAMFLVLLESHITEGLAKSLFITYTVSSCMKSSGLSVRIFSCIHFKRFLMFPESYRIIFVLELTILNEFYMFVLKAK